MVACALRSSVTPKMAALAGLWRGGMERPVSSLFNNIALAVVRLDRRTLWKPSFRQNLGPGIGSSHALAVIGACTVLFRQALSAL